MVKYDFWSKERAEAKVLENGLKVLEKEYTIKDELRYALTIFNPKAIKPTVNYVFKTPETRKAYFDKVVENYDSRQARRLVNKLERAGVGVNIPEVVKVGQIYSASWGYDQTNVDYFQIVAIKGRRVTLRPIAQKYVRSGGFMSEYIVADKDNFKGEPITKIVQFSNGKPYFRIYSFAGAYLWDGKEDYQSHYA